MAAQEKTVVVEIGGVSIQATFTVKKGNIAQGQATSVAAKDYDQGPIGTPSFQLDNENLLNVTLKKRDEDENVPERGQLIGDCVSYVLKQTGSQAARRKIPDTCRRVKTPLFKGTNYECHGSKQKNLEHNYLCKPCAERSPAYKECPKHKLPQKQISSQAPPPPLEPVTSTDDFQYDNNYKPD